MKGKYYSGEYYIHGYLPKIGMIVGDTDYGKWKDFRKEIKMKVKCYNCGLVREAVKEEGKHPFKCPECGFYGWYRLPEEKMKEKIDIEIPDTMVKMAKAFLKVVKEEGIKIVKKDVPTMMEVTMMERAEKEMDRIDPFHYRKECKKKGLAFEIIDIKNGNKVRCRKIYLNGQIEGFKGDPCIANHILPKILALKALLGQMNKDYRDLIETYMVRGLPLEQVPLHELYIKEMEGIENIKI